MIEGKYPPEMYRYFGLQILDECHQMAADCFVRVCQIVLSQAPTGLQCDADYARTARPSSCTGMLGRCWSRAPFCNPSPRCSCGRRDGRSRRVELVGNDWQHVPIPHLPGRMMPVNKAMAASDGRNMEIVNFVMQSYQSGRITLVMSDLRESHLNRLFQMLTNEGIPGEDIGYYVGGMSKVELSHTKKRRVVLGTYKMCSTGTDVPHGTRW